MVALALYFAVSVFGWPLASLSWLLGGPGRWWRSPFSFGAWLALIFLGNVATRGCGVVVDPGSVGYAVFAAVVGLWVLAYCGFLMGVFVRDAVFAVGG